MKSLEQYITERQNNTQEVKEVKNEAPIALLVSTRNSECSILLGESMNEPYNEATVKAICKASGITFNALKDADFDDMDPEDYLAGAVIEEGEIIWYDLLDGTVAPYEGKIAFS